MKLLRYTMALIFATAACICSANAEILPESASLPSAAVEIREIGGKIAGSVTLSPLCEGNYIIIAEYSDKALVCADIREYTTETEEFSVSPEVDTVKVMIWSDIKTMRPVAEARTVDVKECLEDDKKIAKVESGLKSGSNKNVTVYKAEGGEPRAVIWTMGITPPSPSDFKTETDVTDSSYSYIYAEQGKGSGWYDANKSLPSIDGGDRNMCYAAVGANMLHWWLDRNRGYIDEYIASRDTEGLTAEERDRLELLGTLLDSYKSQSQSGIYNLFRRYFESEIYAYNADLMADFFINGYKVNTQGKVNSPSFFKRDHRGGFFYDVFGEDILTMRLSAGNYTAFKRDVLYYMKDGRSIGVIHSTPTYGVTHIITLWGIELDCDGEIVALFVTDSDDCEQPYIGMKRMRLCKNASGYPLITAKAVGNTGALISEFVTLSSGTEYFVNATGSDTGS